MIRFNDKSFLSMAANFDDTIEEEGGSALPDLYRCVFFRCLMESDPENKQDARFNAGIPIAQR